MKAFKKLVFMALCFASISAFGQTADEIVAGNVAAMGGAEKLSSLKTIKMEGSMATQGVDVGIVMTKKHMAGLRLDLDIMGTSNYQLANPTKGWVFMPIMQQTEPLEMDADQLASAQGQLDVQGALFNYKEKGTTVEFLGMDKVDGKDAYKLKVIKNGKTSTYLVDKASNFLVKTVSTANVQGQEMEMETTFSDYKQNADGYWFPYAQTNMQGAIVYDKISTNIPVDDKLFTN